MPENFFTLTNIGIIVGILAPFGAAVFGLGIQHNKINTLQSEVKELKKRLDDISIKFEADLLARKAQEERRRIKKRIGEQEGEESKQ
jgi:outer membrane murein-binding lipoprotein Lpp